MSSTLEHAAGSRHLSLPLMPPEIATRVFCQLPSFTDVFALSSVCHRLRQLWLANVNSIYCELAPKNIPCETAARRFLVYQDGPGLESPLSAKDVVRMLRNAEVVEKAILQFERETVSRVQLGGTVSEYHYGPGVTRHPPKLTPTERTRFIWAYYVIWSLMRLDASEWEARLRGMTSQELYYVWEMSDLEQNIGREEKDPPLRDQHPFPGTDTVVNCCQRHKRALWYEHFLPEQLNINSYRFFGKVATLTYNFAKEEGYFNFVVMFDHFQPTLEDISCHQGTGVWASPEIIKQYLWNNDWGKNL